MIFYFSATGNSKYVATRISSIIGERIISITDCVKNQQFEFEVNENERVGVIAPTYFWGLPTIVNEFLDKMKLIPQTLREPYTYHVATYGTTTGQTGRIVKHFLKSKGLNLQARFCVQMPDTWTPLFDLSDKQEVEKTNRNAEKEIELLCKQIEERTIGDFSKKKMPLIFAKISYIFYEQYRKTKKFKVEDSCIGCELCMNKCPVEAISIEENKPVWIKEKCTLCLCCLHHCPTFSIQYGKNTKKHGQYVNPNIIV